MTGSKDIAKCRCSTDPLFTGDMLLQANIDTLIERLNASRNE